MAKRETYHLSYARDRPAIPVHALLMIAPARPPLSYRHRRQRPSLRSSPRRSASGEALRNAAVDDKLAVRAGYQRLWRLQGTIVSFYCPLPRPYCASSALANRLPSSPRPKAHNQHLGSGLTELRPTDDPPLQAPRDQRRTSSPTPPMPTPETVLPQRLYLHGAAVLSRPSTHFPCVHKCMHAPPRFARPLTPFPLVSLPQFQYGPQERNQEGAREG